MQRPTLGTPREFAYVLSLRTHPVRARSMTEIGGNLHPSHHLRDPADMLAAVYAEARCAWWIDSSVVAANN